MATAFNPALSWPEKIRRELAPSHGRWGGALRTTFAATLAAAILLALQTPMMGPGIYLIFLVSYDVPYLTFRRSAQELSFQCVGVAAALTLIAVTGNDPMARVLGIAAFTFLSGFLLCACTFRVAAMNLGIFPILTLSLWETHLPAEQLVHLSMWPIATGAIAVGLKVAIEYLLTNRDPQRALHLEIKARLDSCQSYFEGFACGQAFAELDKLSAPLMRFAFSGQGKMLALLEEVRANTLYEARTSYISPSGISRIARLLDLAAAFARQPHTNADAAQRAKAAQIAALIRAIQTRAFDELQEDDAATFMAGVTLLEECMEVLRSIAAEAREGYAQPQEALTSPSSAPHKEPWFRPDAWHNTSYLAYAFKLSLCATLCYIIYNALAWPGISTATLTVLIAGLSSTGATNQKMLFRFVGALIGGVLFGIGCMVCVYPYADTALPFLLSVACVSFIGAWIARSAHLGYIGLQIVFSFYLVAFQEYGPPQSSRNGLMPAASVVHGFAAPTQMTLGRDRVLGIMLALLVMWAIFHRLHPERTVDRMRSGLSRLLRIHAQLVRSLAHAPAAEIVALRESANQTVLEVRALAEAIPFELDHHVERDLEICESIQEAIAHTGSLLLYLATATPSRCAQSASPPLTQSMLDSISEGLHSLSMQLDQGGGNSTHRKTSIAQSLQEEFASHPPRVRNALQAYRRLEEQCLKIQAGA